MLLLSDQDVRNLANKLNKGVKLTIFSDSSHSAGLIMSQKEKIGSSTPQARAISRGGVPVQHGEKTFKPDAAHGAAWANRKTKAISTYEVLVFFKANYESNHDYKNLHSALLSIFGNDTSPELGNQTRKPTPTKSKHHDSAILISGCQSNELSQDSSRWVGNHLMGL